MPTDIDAVNKYWSAYNSEFHGKNKQVAWWEAGPEIHNYKNRKVSGNPDVNWTQYTLNKYFNAKLPLARCVSLGCGGGGLERQLASLGAFQHCDAYDVSEGAIRLARERADQLGIKNITYHIADINELALTPNSYDAVWIAQAMHHFEALEHINQQIRRALKPHGLFILQDYVGPNRFQFPARQKEVVNLCLSLLPAQYRLRMKAAVDREMRRSMKVGSNFVQRLIDKIRDGDLIGAIQRRLLMYRTQTGHHVPEKKFINFPSARDVIAADPSEAIRSDEIVEVLQQDFEIIEKKDWGGNILQFLLADIAGNFVDEKHEHAQAYLRMLINIEETFLQSGEFESDFTYIVARPFDTYQI
jgi:2-polyprenyl-3-methyl-5-hydroxy-6-metoxy-1,4-benzoquinol methylase